VHFSGIVFTPIETESFVSLLYSFKARLLLLYKINFPLGLVSVVSPFISPKIFVIFFVFGSREYINPGNIKDGLVVSSDSSKKVQFDKETKKNVERANAIAKRHSDAVAAARAAAAPAPAPVVEEVAEEAAPEVTEAPEETEA